MDLSRFLIKMFPTPDFRTLGSLKTTLDVFNKHGRLEKIPLTPHDTNGSSSKLRVVQSIQRTLSIMGRMEIHVSITKRPWDIKSDPKYSKN